MVDAGHYTQWLVVPAFLGVLLLFVQMCTPLLNGSTLGNTCFSLMIMVWAQRFIEVLCHMRSRVEQPMPCGVLISCDSVTQEHDGEICSLMASARRGA